MKEFGWMQVLRPLASVVFVLLAINPVAGRPEQSAALNPPSFKLVVQVVDEYWRPTGARVEVRPADARIPTYTGVASTETNGCVNIELSDLKADHPEALGVVPWVAKKERYEKEKEYELQ